MSNVSLPPLRFIPQYQYRLWGGSFLNEKLHKDCPKEQIGESWEISAVEGSPSYVANGPFKGLSLPELIKRNPEALLGKAVVEQHGKNFPLLIKFIDAKIPLSVQVHPNDELAKERHNSLGKNEMWYIMDAEKEAELILGFNKKIDAASYASALNENRIEEILHRVNIRKGDAVYVPAGLVHAIGGGIVLAEIQQTSDITYRVYDYNRIDAKTGTKRALHQDLAIKAINFDLEQQEVLQIEEKPNQSNLFLDTPFFKTAFLVVEESIKLNYKTRDAFSVLICVEGEASLMANDHSLMITKGQTVLIPAALEEILLKGKATFLEVTL